MSTKLAAVILAVLAQNAMADVAEPAQEPAPGVVDAVHPAVIPPAHIGGPATYTPAAPLAEQVTLDEAPPLSGGRVVGEALLGSLFAVGGGVGGGYLGYRIEVAGNSCGGDWCGVGGFILGGLAGVTFATPLGVYLAGTTNGETGSLGATIGGSALGMLAGVALTAASEGKLFPALFVGPLAGSMIAFNMTRKYDAPRKSRHYMPIADVTSERSTFGVVGQF